MVTFRLGPLSNEDKVVEVGKRRFGFLWRRWVLWSTIRSPVNRKELEIIELQDKLRKKLSEWKLLADNYLSDLEMAERLARSNFGRSDEQTMDDKLFDERIGRICDQPDDDWIEFFGPKVIREYGLRMSVNRKKGNYEMSYGGISQSRRAGQQAPNPVMPGSGGHVTAYTLGEYADKSIHLGQQTGVDQVVGFKEENRNKGQGPNQKARMQELRKENPKYNGESDQDWNNRLQQMYRDEQGNN